MTKRAAIAAAVVMLALTGCGSDADPRAAEVDARCAELEATVIEGDTATTQAARDSIERTIEALCR